MSHAERAFDLVLFDLDGTLIDSAAQLAMLLERCSDKAKKAFASIHGTPSAVEKAAFDQVLGMLSKSVKQHESAPQEAQHADHHGYRAGNT